MKPVTLTTILALVLAIGCALRKCRRAVQPVFLHRKPLASNEDLRYDIDDFLTS